MPLPGDGEVECTVCRKQLNVEHDLLKVGKCWNCGAPKEKLRITEEGQKKHGAVKTDIGIEKYITNETMVYPSGRVSAFEAPFMFPYEGLITEWYRQTRNQQKADHFASLYGRSLQTQRDVDLVAIAKDVQNIRVDIHRLQNVYSELAHGLSEVLLLLRQMKKDALIRDVKAEKGKP